MFQASGSLLRFRAFLSSDDSQTQSSDDEIPDGSQDAKTLFQEFGWDSWLDKPTRQKLVSFLPPPTEERFIILKNAIAKYFDESILQLKRFPSVIRYLHQVSFLHLTSLKMDGILKWREVFGLFIPITKD